ncbi:MAG: WD40/YVTN/BNR-like repeat-containing protein [Candidatus Sumerlaeota bacterium]
MTVQLIIACKDGVVLAEEYGLGWRLRERTLRDVDATSIACGEKGVFVGTRDGVYYSADGGHDWQECNKGLEPRYVRRLYMRKSLDKPEMLLAGTEPATIQKLHLDQDAMEWEAAPEVAQLRDANGWSLPYSPRAGCVRGFDFRGGRGYAAVEVGGLLVSDDGGETWKVAEGSNGKPDCPDPAEPLIWSDVHSVKIDPKHEGHIYAPTGKGLFKSEDGGANWKCLYRCYVRAVWVDPDTERRVVAGPADYVSEGGRIEITNDDGAHWERVEPGEEGKWESEMIERFVPSSTHLFAVRTDGMVMAAPLPGAEPWQVIVPEITSARALIVKEN